MSVDYVYQLDIVEGMQAAAVCNLPLIHKVLGYDSSLASHEKLWKTFYF